jgi:hypothetical protein
MLNRLSLNRIGLNRIGLNRIGKPSGGSSDRPYIDPKVLNSLCGVWIMDQNTNESESRNIIKNKIADRGGDLELLNFGYKLNSGYNGYAIDFTSWSRLIGIKVFSNKFIIENKAFNCAYYVRDKGEDLDEFKAKITNHTDGIIRYGYINQNGVITYLDITPDNSNRVITFPKSYNSIEGLPNHICGFQTPMFVNTGLTIEQLPLYEGALVTDGKDDMIVSQKTVQEMGITNEITVVSMIHHISNSVYHTNYIRSNTRLLKNYLFETSCGKSFIYGYTATNVGVTGTPNGKLTDVILGDKKDLYTVASNYTGIDSDSKFSIEGYINNVDNSLRELSEVAVYWTFIANKVLTTDEINQIIAYYKLDKYVAPQVIYDVKRQGLTNDTPAADWYLKDFSGNGHDMRLYNYAKKGNSGIGKYETDFTTWSKGHFTDNVNIGSSKIEITGTLTASSILINTNPTSIYNVEIHSPNKSITIYFQYNDVDGTGVKRISLVEGINKLPSVSDSLFVTSDPLNSKGITITQIPDYEGALVSDGKDDYGKAEGLPIFKDYTVAADRAIVDDLPNNADGGVFTKGIDYISGAFVFDYKDQVYSFGVSNDKILDTKRFISYQSKYVNNGKSISAGTTTDINPLLLAKLGSKNDRYSALALYSMLLFPYSLSEFLLERQLKKYKLGTLYPDMVEFRPIIKSNSEYQVVDFYIDNLPAVVGKYYPINSALRIAITTQGQVDEVSSIKVNGVDFGVPNINGNRFTFNGTLSDKSPQKIDITIDEYIRFEDIVQPYPEIWTITQNGNKVSWGDKLKVGSEFGYNSKVNLLSDVYTTANSYYNGKVVKTGDILKVEKQMTFACDKTWKLNTTEPHAIYSPQKLNIPNSSLKILGYVPDLTGKGNNGKLNNFAYTEDSGVTADGSVKFDGTDDHITIPTLAHGGKCVMMKVNWNKNNSMLYDQRVSYSTKFAVLINAGTIAYNQTNPLGVTYIDGIENTNILCDELKGITHNIVSANANPDNSKSPNIGVNLEGNGGFSDMSLYEFMLFPEIPSEDEIKKLNNVMGIEGGYVESPNYYWDAYGKANRASADIDYKDLNSASDAHKQLIDKSIEGLAAIELYHSTGNFSGIRDRRLYLNNVGYNSESGYGGKGFVPFNGDWRHDEGKLDFQFITNGIHVTKSKATLSNWFWTNNPTVKGAKTKYKITGVTFDRAIRFFNGLSEYQLVINKDGIYEVDGSLLVDGDGNPTGLSIGDNGWVGDCDIVIEQLTEYPNGLLLDGVEDHAVNTVIPAVTDYTWIMKREILGKKFCPVAYKGDGSTYLGGSMWFEQSGGGNGSCSFGSVFAGGLTFPKLISYQTKTSYNGTSINPGTDIDGTKLVIGARPDIQEYLDLVFYKAMLYTKTIDQLSINMLKNLFERDELIDVTNPIFKKQ